MFDLNNLDIALAKSNCSSLILLLFSVIIFIAFICLLSFPHHHL